MDVVGRTLEPAVLLALNHWPRYKHTQPQPQVDLTALPPFFDGLLRELPWWNPTWRIIHVEPAYPHEFPSERDRQRNRFTEVSVPGVLGADGTTAAFVGRVRFEGDRLLRFQAKIGDVVLGSAVAEAGKPEPHPFAALLRGFMDNRDMSVQDLAYATERAMATIAALRHGAHSPHPVIVAELARALDLPAGDLAVIAGVEADETPP
ncbi:helix-turn-helix domain-containing protein [Catellatospora sichuanensis]|uniref:helix-turn-helix domain-containing protein n=1 Tax=Catellatospora sichuanensis TaxID=1969805 RepID=UPI00118396E7|nr:helix-turn-helix transcriptional regulator [Catellatospora sichuanensis]